MKENSMKKRLSSHVSVRWVLPVCLLACLPVQAQRLVVAEPEVNCGRTGFQQPVTATFEMRNKGLRRLVIESVKPDCGCTAVEYPKSVGIGEKFTIKMTYDARMLGHFQKMAAIKSNGSKQPVYLIMKGVVVPEVLDYTGTYPYKMGDLLLDKTDLEFDDVNKGDQPIQEIHVLNNGDKAIQPHLLHLPSYLTASAKPEVLKPGKSGTITVTLYSDRLRDYGLTQTSVYMAQKLGEKVRRDHEMGVSVVLLPHLQDYDAISKANAPQLQISTTDVDLTDFAGKKKKTVEVVLFNQGKSVLKVSSMQLFTRGLSVTLGTRELAPAQTTTLKITGIADELRKLRTKPRILMITNDPDHPKVIINIKHK